MIRIAANEFITNRCSMRSWGFVWMFAAHSRQLLNIHCLQCGTGHWSYMGCSLCPMTDAIEKYLNGRKYTSLRGNRDT